MLSHSIVTYAISPSNLTSLEHKFALLTHRHNLYDIKNLGRLIIICQRMYRKRRHGTDETRKDRQFNMRLFTQFDTKMKIFITMSACSVKTCRIVIEVRLPTTEGERRFRQSQAQRFENRPARFELVMETVYCNFDAEYTLKNA